MWLKNAQTIIVENTRTSHSFSQFLGDKKFGQRVQVHVALFVLTHKSFARQMLHNYEQTKDVSKRLEHAGSTLA